MLHLLLKTAVCGFHFAKDYAFPCCPLRSYLKLSLFFKFQMHVLFSGKWNDCLQGCKVIAAEVSNLFLSSAG